MSDLECFSKFGNKCLFWSEIESEGVSNMYTKDTYVNGSAKYLTENFVALH